MKKLIFKKLLKDILYFFLLVSLSICLIVWVIQAVNYLDIVTEDGHGFNIYFMYTLFNLPKIFSKTLLFIFFVSLYYIILKYENDNELLIFWTHGVKKMNFINVVIIFSIFFLIIQMMFTTYFVPKSQDLARSYIRSSSIDLFPSLIKEKKFIDTVSNLTIFIEEKNIDGFLKKIFLKERISKSRSQTIYAENGLIKTIDGKTFIILYDGKIINRYLDRINTFSFTETQIDLTKYKTKTITFPKVQELMTSRLLDCILHLRSNQKRALKYSGSVNCKPSTYQVILQEFFKRFYLPIYIPITALLASLLIFRSKDSFNFNYYKILIFIFGLITIITSEISIRYVGTTFSNNVFFILLPLIIFFSVYIRIFTKSKLQK